MSEKYTFEQIQAIKNETQQVALTYEVFDEDSRLNRSQAARVEFLTTIRYIDRYLRPGMRVLDIGAGAGEYSLHYARQGYEVCALELSPANIAAFEKKRTPDLKLDLRQGNALDLSAYADASFDIVLLMGPLYHLHSADDRQQAIAEAKRVCKPMGTIFFAFINNDMIPLTELMYLPDFFTTGDYNHETFKMDDFPFVFFTLDQCRQMLRQASINILHTVASDGVSELLARQINAMNEENYQQYLRYHFYCCEKPEMLGRSNHLLFVGSSRI